MNRQKITWLQILQGWSMLLVVIGHVTLTGIFENPQTPVSATIERVIYSFHMPLFMFISGFLFYFTKISRDLAYKEVVFDKLKRLGNPLFVLHLFHLRRQVYILTIHETPGRIVFTTIYRQFLYPGSNPLSEMWFVATLFIIMLSYPLLKYMITGHFKIAVLIIGSVVLNLFFPPDIFLLCLSNVAYMFLFFCLGILFCKFDIQRFLSHSGSLLLSLLLFIALNLIPDCPILLLNLTGIIFSVSLCLNLTPIVSGLFSSFRDYTFQIFLLGIFPQIAIRILYSKIPQNELSYWSLYIISILLGIYLPVFIAKIVEKIPNKLIRRCFGL